MRFPRLAVLILFTCPPAVLRAQFPLPPNQPLAVIPLTESIQNLHILPTANAPFSAMVSVNVRSHFLNDDSKWSYQRIARDSAGRIFEEVRNFADEGCGDDPCPIPTPWVTDRIYIDPIQHTAYDCTTKGRLCHVISYERMTVPALDARRRPRLSARGKDLGKKKIDGLWAVGSVQTLGFQVKTTWYSADLHIYLDTKYASYPSGFDVQSYQIKNLKRSEPSPTLFVPPAKYKFASSAPRRIAPSPAP